MSQQWMDIQSRNNVGYLPLTSSEEIRLLYLQPRDHRDTIQCSIKYVSIDEEKNPDGGPWYEALSYTWGANDMMSIKINGRRCEVRQNLWQALYHLRLESAPRVLWIDAICINQADASERNRQVALMGKIYTCASNVIAWLGEADLSSSSAFRYFRTLDARKPALDLMYKVRGIYDEDLAASEISSHDIGSDILELCSRDYWSRLWIIQEIALAPRVILQCDWETLDWAHLVAFFACVRKIIGKGQNGSFRDALIIDQPGPVPLPSLLASTPGATVVNTRSSTRSFNLGQGFEPQLKGLRPILSLIIDHATARCSDDRDKVFGLAGLAMDCCAKAIEISYSVTFVELCDQVLTHHLVYHEPQHKEWWKESALTTARIFFRETHNGLLSLNPEGDPIHGVPVHPEPLSDHKTFGVQGRTKSYISWLTPNLDDDLVITTLDRRQLNREMIKHLEPTRAASRTRHVRDLLRIPNDVKPVHDKSLHDLTRYAPPLSSVLKQYLGNSTVMSPDVEYMWLAEEVSIFQQLVAAAKKTALPGRACKLRLAVAGNHAFFVPENTEIGDLICYFPYQSTLLLLRRQTLNEDKVQVVGVVALVSQDDLGMYSDTFPPNSDVEPDQYETQQTEQRLMRFEPTHLVNLHMSLSLLRQLSLKNQV